MPQLQTDEHPAARFGLLRYRNTGNLGDEIQSLAARRFLPNVDRLLDRDRLHAPGILCPSLRMILNGWFLRAPENWPPHSNIHPLLISFHLSDQMTCFGFSAAEALVVGPNAAWLRRHGPVGARDLWTLDLLRRNGIDAWFSGCLTLTLDAPKTDGRRDYIVMNDVPEEILSSARESTRGEIVTTTHVETSTRSSHLRFAQAESLLLLYAQARSVVTTRLHCALPCLAMGTPVLLLLSDHPSKRFSGLASLVNTRTLSEFLDGQGRAYLNAPWENPQTYAPLRRALVQKCRAFVA